MICPHCSTENASGLPYGRSIDGGRAFAQVCTACGRVLGLRPRRWSDPVPGPAELTDRELERLRFHQWRLRALSHPGGSAGA